MSQAARNQLMTLTKDLLRHWDTTRESWQDQKAESFEREFLVELESSVNRSIHAMEKLDQMVARVRRDCE